MKILAFDTSTTACSVALQNDDHIVHHHEIAPMQQTALILPTIENLLSSLSLTLPQLDAIAFGCGPGSFTGIRIASSVAQGLGFVIEKPLIPISSLAILAQTMLMQQKQSSVLVAVDARMGQLYWAMYEKNTQGYMQEIDEELLCKPDEISIPSHKAWYGVGDGWKQYEKELVTRLDFTPTTIDSEEVPHAYALLTLANIKLKAGEWVKAADALPTYLK